LEVGLTLPIESLAPNHDITPAPAAEQIGRRGVCSLSEEEMHMARRGMPSMVALLGLLAVAGYQNREKLAEMFGKLGEKGGTGQSGGLGGLLGNLGGLLGGSTPGGVVSGGIGDLLERFKEAGQGDKAESWIKAGPNTPIAPDELERALGSDVIDRLTQQTGLSRQELLLRLSRTLPEAVDKYTPEGRIPSEEDAPRV
jgi:uncharacterized protein YidB (DUF937 family)